MFDQIEHIGTVYESQYGLVNTVFVVYVAESRHTMTIDCDTHRGNVQITHCYTRLGDKIIKSTK